MRQMRKAREKGAETEGAAMVWSHSVKEWELQNRGVGEEGDGSWETNRVLVRDWSMWDLRKVRRAVLRVKWFSLEA